MNSNLISYKWVKGYSARRAYFLTFTNISLEHYACKSLAEHGYIENREQHWGVKSFRAWLQQCSVARKIFYPGNFKANLHDDCSNLSIKGFVTVHYARMQHSCVLGSQHIQ
jgi:hypothetical protein